MKKNLQVFLFIMFFRCLASVGQARMSNGSLGIVNFPVTGLATSQEPFQKAVILLHHMTYPQARNQFSELILSDSTCAMAYWGVAMALFQPIWPTRPGKSELLQGWHAIQTARSITPVTKREKLLMDATAAFFTDPESADYWKRIQAWAQGMETAYKAFPDDHEVAAFYALSLLAIIPPDQINSAYSARAAGILIDILQENPHHPGAMHYLIHANDAPGREHENPDVLHRYEAIAPNNPHALHMPTHIYTRLGEWKEVIQGNLKAADAALLFPAGINGEYIWDEYPHAIEYLIYAYLQLADDKSAETQLVRLQQAKNLEPTFKTAFHLASTRARFALERKAWMEAADIDPLSPSTVEWKRFPWPEAISWFARGLGRVHINDTAEAHVALTHIIQLETEVNKTKELLFSRNISILKLELSAWIAAAEGMLDSAITLMKQAAEIESSSPKHAVTPAATLPSLELLGDYYLTIADYNNAHISYQHSLEMFPERLNSLAGLAFSSIKLNDNAGAKRIYQQLVDKAPADTKRECIVDGRRYLAR